MDLSSFLQWFLYLVWSMFIGFYGPKSNWRSLENISFTFLLHSLHFRKHICFNNVRVMFRCRLFALFVVICCTNVGVILVCVWHQNKKKIDTEFLTISWCVFYDAFWYLNDPFGVPLAHLYFAKYHYLVDSKIKKSNFDRGSGRILNFGSYQYLNGA